MEATHAGRHVSKSVCSNALYLGGEVNDPLGLVVEHLWVAQVGTELDHLRER